MTIYMKKEEKVAQKEEDVRSSKDTFALEIIAFLTLLSITITSEASKTLGLEKLCSYTHLARFCYNFRTPHSWDNFHDGIIYEMHAEHFMWGTAVQSVLCCVLLAFLGGWSDKTGRRKVILTVPTFGLNLQILNCFIHNIFFYVIPFESFLFFDSFFGSVVGYSIVFLGFFLYLYDMTLAENRVYRFATIVLCGLSGVALGTILSRMMLIYLGYFVTYVTAFIINTQNRRYIYKALEDPVRTNEQIMFEQQECKASLKTFFDCSTVKETARAVNKTEPNRRNVYMYVYLATGFLLFISVFGESTVFDLVARHGYSWDKTTVAVFNMYCIISTILGVWFATAVVSKGLKQRDAVIGITACIGKILSSCIFAFASPDNVLYLGPAISMLNGTSLLAIAFMMIKRLEQNEIGKIASLVAIVECIARLLYVVIYYFVYVGLYTPTAVFLFGAGFTAPALFVFIWILNKEKRDETAQTSTEGIAANI